MTSSIYSEDVRNYKKIILKIYKSDVIEYMFRDQIIVRKERYYKQKKLRNQRIDQKKLRKNDQASESKSRREIKVNC